MDIIRERNHVICCLSVRYLKTLTEYEKKRLDLYIRWETPNHYFALSSGNTLDVILIRPTTTEGQLTLYARWIRRCLIFVFIFSSSANKGSAVLSIPLCYVITFWYWYKSLVPVQLRVHDSGIDFQVSVEWKDVLLGGGVLVADQWVLTAAYNVDG